ncbi:MAG TPA: type II asparaginase [Polyangiales bacterium]|nr:type II asparaginase [Polyangiales bacterium]
MQITRYAAVVLALLGPVLSASNARADGLPKVAVLATGGTIAGSAPGPTDPGYMSGQVSVDFLLAAVPELKDIAEAKGEQISNVGSQNMSDEIWLTLAKRIEALAATDVAGIVITHGTDTMEETAYFLSLVAHTDKPIVLTGAMRPSTAISADGPVNIYNAVAVAVNPSSVGLGVMVVLNDEIHDAHSVFKSHETEVSTFNSGDHGLVGTVEYGDITYFRTPYTLHGLASEFSVSGVDALPRVDIVYAHEGMDGGLIDAAVALGAKGIVTAGVGNGNLTDAALDTLSKAAATGVVSVRSSRVPLGATGRSVEVDDDALGLVAAYELTPPKARILLRLALLKTTDPLAIQTYFESY